MANTRANKTVTESPEEAKAEKSIAATEPQKEETPKQEAKVEIPKYADKILKMYPELKAMYVSKQGGAFTVDTPGHMREGAVLYENKYYNNNKK